MLSKLAACALAAVASAQVELKVGAALHATGTGNTGKVAYQEWDKWVKAQTNLDYTVSLTVHDYDANALQSVIGNFTAPGAEKVDVLVVPYGSGTAIKAIGFIDDSFTGPVMVWGGASDSIFASDGPCAGKSFTCFGFFTVGSQYMTSGLTAINDKTTDKLKVLLVENQNAFSHSVCTGAEATIGSLAKLEVDGERIICAEKTDPTAEELATIAERAAAADVIAICGHHGFVEPVIKKIGDTTTPKAIISTNALTSSAVTEIGDKANCLMMPTQWAESDLTDSVVGWDSAAFKTAAGSAATYHGASGAASAIIISHAMAANSDISKLPETIAGLPAVTTFYGPVDFEASGAIKKPMYTQQRQGGENKIVAPSTETTHHAKEADMMFPLNTCDGWTGDAGSDAIDGGSTGVDGAANISGLFGIVLALVLQYARA